MLLVPVNLSSALLCVDLKERHWKEKRGPKMVMEPCSPPHWHHPDWAGGVTEFSLQPHFRTCAELYVALVGAVYYLPGSVPSACLPALRKPNNATLLGLLPLWTAAQWKKRRRTWQGGKGKCRKGHIWPACRSRCDQDLGDGFPRPWPLTPYLYRCRHIPNMLHIRVELLTWNNKRLNFDSAAESTKACHT